MNKEAAVAGGVVLGVYLLYQLYVLNQQLQQVNAAVIQYAPLLNKANAIAS